MSSASLWFAVILAFLAECSASSTQSWAQEPINSNDDEARKVRLEFMKEFRTEFKLFGNDRPEEPLAALDEPLVRWTNPIRNSFSDGALFLWLDGKRPVATATVSIRGSGGVWFESASLSPGALRCLRRDGLFWNPQSAGSAEQRLMDAPVPAATGASRLVQMRRLSEQFSIRMEPLNEQPSQLRLMPQPIYRYEDNAAGVVDGAVFAFAEGTDPEALLLLEAVRTPEAEAANWQYTLAKMTSRRIVARRNDEVIWSAPGYWLNPRSITDAYQERQLSVYPPPIR
jgi:hypothetical protein